MEDLEELFRAKTIKEEKEKIEHFAADPGESRPIRLPRGDLGRWLHAGEMGVGRRVQGRSESEQFSFYAEESAQFPGEEIFPGGRNEGVRNPVLSHVKPRADWDFCFR
jgi:hypothetical protein